MVDATAAIKRLEDILNSEIEATRLLRAHEIDSCERHRWGYNPGSDVALVQMYVSRDKPYFVGMGEHQVVVDVGFGVFSR